MSDNKKSLKEKCQLFFNKIIRDASGIFIGKKNKNIESAYISGTTYNDNKLSDTETYATEVNYTSDNISSDINIEEVETSIHSPREKIVSEETKTVGDEKNNYSEEPASYNSNIILQGSGTFLGKIRSALAVDFDKPLTLRDEGVILFINILVSIFLFTVVYAVAPKSGNIKDSGLNTPALNEISTESDTNVLNHSDVISENENSASNKKRALVSDSQKSNSSKTDKPAVGSLIEGFETISKEYDEIYEGDLILVNKDCECHGDGENTVSLMDLKTSSYGITDNSVRLNESIVDSANKMFDDFYDLYGDSDIIIACGYRSYTLQRELYLDEVMQRDGDEEVAAKWVAPPGYSEHQTGYVFDLDVIGGTERGIQYSGTGKYEWINQNCFKYGFILRYLQGKEDITGIEYEPWHFRYVGQAHATYIMDKYITLEEYIDIVHTHDKDNPLHIEDENGNEWCTYYYEADYGTNEVPVPSDYEYTVSGDNYSGFIITVKLI